MKAMLNVFLTSAIEKGKKSASYPEYFIPRKRTSSTHKILG
jgi:hypothetical protein